MTAAVLQRPLRSPLAAFAGLAAVMARVPADAADRLCAAMSISRQREPSRSTLNNDGSPLQICVGLNRSDAPPAIRLIADPAAAASDSTDRFRSMESALANILASHGPRMAPLCQSILGLMLPADPVTRAALGNGGAWLAADLRGRGMALYATAKWGDPSTRWTRVQEWLDIALPDGATAREMLGRLSPHATPVSVGVEGASPGNARAKLYWRLDGTAALDGLRIPLLARPEIAAFLADTVGNRRIPISAIVGSISFHLQDGGVSDVKLDLCGHCVSRSWPDWTAILRRCSARYGLAEFPLADLGSEPKAEIAFFGFGLGSKLTPRLNIYLKPRSRLP